MLNKTHFMKKKIFICIVVILCIVSDQISLCYEDNFENINSSALRQLTKEQVNLILIKHKEWITTNGKDGCIADFSNTNLKGVDFSNAKLQNAIFNNAILINTNFSNANLSESKLTNTDLRNAHFVDSNLTGAYLNQSNLRGITAQDTNFSNADMSGVDLADATIFTSNFQNTILSEANLENTAFLLSCNLSNANITFASLQNTQLSGVNLSNTNFMGSNLTYANLSNAILTNSRFDGADISNSLIMNSDLTAAILQNATSISANFNKSILSKVDATGSDLTHSCLSETKTQNANFEAANLSFVDFSYADISNSIFTKSDLSFVNLYKSTINDVILQESTLNNTIFDSTNGIPNKHYITNIIGLETLQVNTGEGYAGLSVLRNIFKENGLRDQERKVTYAIAISQLKRKNMIDKAFHTMLFLLPCSYGLYPNRSLSILIFSIFLFASIYYIPIVRITNHGAIYKKHESDQLADKGNNIQNSTRVTKNMLIGVFWAIYFSIISAFSIGWRDFNIGIWISKMQYKEFELKSSGWIRTVSGIQSLISVYLLAIWIMTYFGRPFE